MSRDTGAHPPESPHRLTGTAFAAELRGGLSRLFREHATIGLTLTYLFLTVVGAAYEFSLLINFRINVFQYADPVDYLLAAIRQPLITLFAVAPLAIILLLDAGDRLLRRRFGGYARFSAWSERRGGLGGPSARISYRVLYATLIVLYFTALTLRFADFIAARLARGGGRTVSVALTSRGVRDTNLLRGTLLGTTSRYVFVYEPADSTTHVIPLGNIADMILEPSARGRRK